MSSRPQHHLGSTACGEIHAGRHTRRFVWSTSALIAIALAFVPSAALADCLADASGLTVNCTTADPNGYVAGVDNPTVDNVTINVDTAATVGGAL